MEEVRVNEKHQVELINNGRTECYELSKVPDEKSGLVQRERQMILHQMDLKTVISNLDNSVDLLDVAYHAVYGFTVHKKIFALQKNLMDLNDRGIKVIGRFRTKSAQILTEMVSMFDWLTKGVEAVAIGKLEKFTEIASGMSQDAQNLADSYEEMAEKTSGVLQETMGESSKQYEKSDKLRQMMSDFEAEQETAARTQESVATRLKSLKQEYNSLKDAEDKAEKRENTLAIMGAVFSFLGSAASIAGDVMDSKDVIPKKDSESQEKVDEAKQKKDAAAAKVTALEEELKALNENLAKAIADKDAAAAGEKEALETKCGECRTMIQKKNAELDTAKKEEKSATNTLGSVSKLLNGAAEATAQLQNGSSGKDSIAISRAERLSKIYDEMIKLEEENTRQLGLLAKYTKQMEGVVIDQHATDAAIQALIIAISCLKRVIVAVKDIALFWNSMEACCRSLAESSLKDTIKDLQSIDKAERIEFYFSEDVMYPLLTYMGRWSAVQSVSSEFIEAAENTRMRLNKTITTADDPNVTREEHWTKASELAGEVSNQLSLQMDESRNKIKALEDQKTA